MLYRLAAFNSEGALALFQCISIGQVERDTGPQQRLKNQNFPIRNVHLLTLMLTHVAWHQNGNSTEVAMLVVHPSVTLFNCERLLVAG